MSLLCLLHDIGKIGVPMEILNKPGKLTDEEWKIMRSHVEKGYDIANSNVELKQIAEKIRHHHERWDGKGYPDGLTGEEIPISAQVVSIVDVYDALTSERCYKKAFDHDTAIQMILDGQCGQFNPLLLKCLKELSLQLQKCLVKRWTIINILMKYRDFRMKYSVINPYRTRFIHRVLSRSCRKKSISSNRTVA